MTDIDKQLAEITAKYFMATDPDRIALQSDLKALVAREVVAALKYWLESPYVTGNAKVLIARRISAIQAGLVGGEDGASE